MGKRLKAFSELHQEIPDTYLAAIPGLQFKIFFQFYE